MYHLVQLHGVFYLVDGRGLVFRAAFMIVNVLLHAVAVLFLQDGLLEFMHRLHDIEDVQG